MHEVVEKKCTKCGQFKPVENFAARKGKTRRIGSTHTECKQCANARRAELRKERYANEPGFAEKAIIVSKTSYNKQRHAAIMAYGGMCACCGEDNELFLTFDHINNDGYIHRKSLGGRNCGGKRMVNWIAKNGYPQTIQLLCYNCNCARGFYGQCPHKSNRKRLLEIDSPAVVHNTVSNIDGGFS